MFHRLSSIKLADTLKEKDSKHIDELKKATRNKFELKEGNGTRVFNKFDRSLLLADDTFATFSKFFEEELYSTFVVDPNWAVNLSSIYNSPTEMAKHIFSEGEMKKLTDFLDKIVEVACHTVLDEFGNLDPVWMNLLELENDRPDNLELILSVVSSFMERILAFLDTKRAHEKSAEYIMETAHIHSALSRFILYFYNIEILKRTIEHELVEKNQKAVIHLTTEMTSQKLTDVEQKLFHELIHKLMHVYETDDTSLGVIEASYKKCEEVEIEEDAFAKILKAILDKYPQKKSSTPSTSMDDAKSPMSAPARIQTNEPMLERKKEQLSLTDKISTLFNKRKSASDPKEITKSKSLGSISGQFKEKMKAASVFFQEVINKAKAIEAPDSLPSVGAGVKQDT